MNTDSVMLLKECDAGSKMAVESIGQFRVYAEDSTLKSCLDKYIKKHEAYGSKCRKMLVENNECPQDPSRMASAFAKISTDVKMMLDKDSSKIANLLIDGCNMGIKSTTENMHKYSNATPEAMNIAKEMIQLEQEMSKELLGFL